MFTIFIVRKVIVVRNERCEETYRWLSLFSIRTAYFYFFYQVVSDQRNFLERTCALDRRIRRRFDESQDYVVVSEPLSDLRISNFINHNS